MLQANPSLTPNAVKAILQYTAQEYPGYNALDAGRGLPERASAPSASRGSTRPRTPGATIPVQTMWSKHIIWGNHRARPSGTLNLSANAFRVGTSTGASPRPTTATTSCGAPAATTRRQHRLGHR